VGSDLVDVWALLGTAALGLAILCFFSRIALAVADLALGVPYLVLAAWRAMRASRGPAPAHDSARPGPAQWTCCAAGNPAEAMDSGQPPLLRSERRTGTSGPSMDPRPERRGDDR
jgi:hypothetical protein